MARSLADLVCTEDFTYVKACEGPPCTYRTVTTIWREFFHAPATNGEGRWTIWDRGPKKQSRLIAEGAKDYGRKRRIRMVK